MHGLALWMPSAAEHGMNIQLTSLGLCLMNQLCWLLYHGLNDLIVLGMIVDSVLSKSGESDFFCSELHKVAHQGWHVCDITCGPIRHNLFGQVDSNLVMIYRTWFWSLLPGLARLVNLGEIEYNSDFFGHSYAISQFL